MHKDELKKIDKKELPWFYKLILKIPTSDFLQGASGGIFWAITVPIFLVLEMCLNFFLLLFFPFPTNIILTATIPVAVLIIFIRISLERFINWWNLTIDKSGFEWNVEKTMPEYLKLLRKEKKNNNEES